MNNAKTYYTDEYRESQLVERQKLVIHVYRMSPDISKLRGWGLLIKLS